MTSSIGELKYALAYPDGEIERSPKVGKRYEQGNPVILIFPRGAS